MQGRQSRSSNVTHCVVLRYHHILRLTRFRTRCEIALSKIRRSIPLIDLPVTRFQYATELRRVNDVTHLWKLGTDVHSGASRTIHVKTFPSSYPRNLAKTRIDTVGPTSGKFNMDSADPLQFREPILFLSWPHLTRSDRVRSNKRNHSVPCPGSRD